MFNFPATQRQALPPLQVPNLFDANLLCPEGLYDCLQVCFRLFTRYKHLALMFFTRLMTTLAYLYNLVGWLKMYILLLMYVMQYMHAMLKSLPDMLSLLCL